MPPGYGPANNAGEAVFVEYVVWIMYLCGKFGSSRSSFGVSWALAGEMSHCLCLVVTSRALSCCGDIHVEQIIVKPYVSSD